MPVRDLIALAGFVTVLPNRAEVNEESIRAIALEFRAHSPANRFYICPSGDYSLVCEEDQLNSLLDQPAFSERDTQVLLSLPLRPYVRP